MNRGRAMLSIGNLGMKNLSAGSLNLEKLNRKTLKAKDLDTRNNTEPNFKPELRVKPELNVELKGWTRKLNTLGFNPVSPVEIDF